MAKKTYQHSIYLKDILNAGEKVFYKKAANKVISKKVLALIKQDMLNSQSSVTGKPFRHLKNKSYQKLKGSIKANLKLAGDLQNAIKSTAYVNQTKIAILESQALKCENHLKVDGQGNKVERAAEKKTGVRQRVFFPTGSQELRAGIKKQLREAISSFIEKT